MSSYLCRLCFETQIRTINDYSNYFQTIGCLMDVFPGMNFNLTNSIELCRTCLSNLQLTINLKQRFLEGKSTFLNRDVTISSRYCTVCFESENSCLFVMFNPNSKTVLKVMIQIVLAVNLNDDNPNVCQLCWSQIKAIHSFKIYYIKMEKSLKDYCIKKQLSKLTQNDMKTIVTEQVETSVTFHQEYFEKYGQVFPNLDYDSLLQDTNLTQHENIEGENPEVTDENCTGGEDYEDDDCIVVEDNINADEETRSAIGEDIPNLDLNNIFEYNNNDATIIIEDDETLPVKENANFCLKDIIEYDNIHSACFIADEATRSAIEKNKRNFDLNKIDEHYDNATIVIENDGACPVIEEENKMAKYNNNNYATIDVEDYLTRSAIVKENINFHPKKNVEAINIYPTIIIDDEETDSDIVENNATLNQLEIAERNDNIIDDGENGSTSNKLNYYESFNEDETSGKKDKQLNDNVLVIDQDICELTTEHIFVETKFDMNKTQLLLTNTGRSSTNLKIWGCYVCSQVFMEKQKMRNHLMKHELPENKYGGFKCKICPYRCKLVGALIKHNLIHSKKFHVRFSGLEAKYFCQYCDEFFSRQVDIRLHMAQHIISSNKFLCTVCFMRTDTSEALRVHYRWLHSHKKQR